MDHSQGGVPGAMLKTSRGGFGGQDVVITGHTDFGHGPHLAGQQMGAAPVGGVRKVGPELQQQVLRLTRVLLGWGGRTVRHQCCAAGMRPTPPRKTVSAHVSKCRRTGFLCGQVNSTGPEECIRGGGSVREGKQIKTQITLPLKIHFFQSNASSGKLASALCTC